MKIIIINSHPIQYFAPLYKYLTENGIDLEVWYCSDFSIKGKTDEEFGVNVKWDIPLLEGYSYRFFKNYSRRSSVGTSFFGLVNWGIIKALWKHPEAIVVVPGWLFFPYILSIYFGHFFKHHVCLRSETPLNQEKLKKSTANKLKLFFLRRILFPSIKTFLYVGIQNKAFYRFLGVKDEQLIYSPYAVDNNRFRAEYVKMMYKKDEIRNSLGIDVNAKVLLYSGKYIAKKNPLDLLEAFRVLNLPDKYLIMLGEGALRREMEEFIAKHGLKEKVLLTGFVNQSEIGRYYSCADAFVMCSSSGETWGLSVNEAMNFSLPVVVSDLTGCAVDLVEDGKNGYKFETGNIEMLANRIEALFTSDFYKEAGNYSFRKIQHFSFREVLHGYRELAVRYHTAS